MYSNLKLYYFILIHLLFVIQELDLLTEENKVYKLIGPALVGVDIVDAKQNVAKRLEFIETEIKKIDNQMEACTTEQNKLGEEVSSFFYFVIYILLSYVFIQIMKLQTAMQQEAAEAAKKIALEA